MKIKIEEISNSKKFFTREGIDDQLVEEYTELLRAGITLPPVTVFYDDELKSYVMIDGFHTYHAALNARVQFIEIGIVNKTSDLNLIVESLKKNSQHGKPLSSRDKRRNIEKILSFQEGWDWSNSIIANIVGASDRTVSNIKKTMVSPKISGTDIVKCLRSGKLHTVTLAKNKNENDYGLALAAINSSSTTSLGQSEYGTEVGYITSEMGIDQTYPYWNQNSRIPNLLTHQGEVSESDAINILASMRGLQQIYIVYNKMYDNANDGAELIDFTFVKKLEFLLGNLRTQTDELLRLINR